MTYDVTVYMLEWFEDGDSHLMEAHCIGVYIRLAVFTPLRRKCMMPASSTVDFNGDFSKRLSTATVSGAWRVG